MNTAMRVTTRTLGLAVKSPRFALATADMCAKFSRDQMLLGVSPVCDTPFWNGGLCARGSSTALSPAPSGSARVSRPSLSRACGSRADALPDLPGVVTRVDDMETHPLLDGQVAHARMLHEQVGASLRQQRAVDLIPDLKPGEEMRFRCPAIDARWWRSTLRRLPSGWKPAQSHNEEPGDLLGRRARASRHRRMVAAREERFAAQRQGEREMLDDLRGRPLPGRAVLPFAVRTPPERTEHEVRQLTERFHTRHRVRGRGPLVSTRPDMRGICE